MTMLKTGIIGGETHIDELISLNGKRLAIISAAVRPDQADWAREKFDRDKTREKMLEAYRKIAGC